METNLRPLERRVLALQAEGQDTAEIARRFRRSPDHIERVMAWTAIPRQQETRSEALSAVERRVLAWRDSGATYDEIGHKFRRSADHIRRVEAMAYLRKGMELLG